MKLGAENSNNIRISRVCEDCIAIYVHVPYCIKKCPYCDFYSVSRKNISIRDGHEYGFLLAREIKFLRKKFHDAFEKPLLSVYFGGGTPSIFEPVNYTMFFKEIENIWGDFRNAEITLEANPETLCDQKISEFLDLGFNRISLGVQSLSNKILQKLGRVHTAEKSLEIIQSLKSFKNLKSFNIDLMFAIPAQTPDEFKETLKEAIALSPPHVSIYEMTFHPHTQYYHSLKKGEIEEATEDVQIEMFKTARALMLKHGYEHYEISNYAKRGHRSLHNMNYWLGNEYLGLGAGAHSYIGGIHYFNPEDLNFYRNKILEEKLAIVKDHELTRQNLIKERLMLAIRMLDGINIRKFNEKNSCNLEDEFSDEIKNLSSLRLINLDEGKLKLTEKGILLADEVTSSFF